MASKKIQLKRHIEYLYARRSGAEYCQNLIVDVEALAKVKKFVHSLSTSITEKSIELATIEQAEAAAKAKEKAEAAAARKARQLA